MFVDAMMNALTLSVQYQDFIDRYGDSERSRNAYLLRTATKKVAMLPFAYAANIWHSDAVRGIFPPKRMNDFWWSKRFVRRNCIRNSFRSRDDDQLTCRTLNFPMAKRVFGKKNYRGRNDRIHLYLAYHYERVYFASQ